MSQTYRRQLILMLTPFLLGTLLLIAAPGVLTALLAFFHYDGLSQPVFARLANFAELGLSPLYGISVRNSLVFMALAVPLRLCVAFGLALLLRAPRRGVNAYRASVFLPTLMPDIAYALIWLWLLNPLYGPLNLILRGLGLPAPAWLVTESTALPALVLMTLFQIGEGFVVLLAALAGIPRELYEAATADGADRWQRFWHVTLPLVTPWLLLVACRDAILTFQSTFVPALVMTGGDPNYATYFLPLAVYEAAFDSLRFGVASALMWVMYVLTGAVLVFFFRISRRWLFVDEV